LAFVFKPGEAAQTGLRRIADEQVSKALARMKSDRGGEETVHECRKALKRLKSLFKLVRRGLGKSLYRREYSAVRDIGRSLSSVRDFEVMPNTLALLAATAGTTDPETVGRLQRIIARKHARLSKQTDRAEMLVDAIGALEAARRRYRVLKLREDTFEMLADGAAAGLKTLHRQHAIALASGEDEDYHEWRKSAQLHWRHLRLMTNVWPELIGARLKATKALAMVLGHDHDLAVLLNFVAALPSSSLKAANRKALIANIRERQLELRAEARAYAGLLVADEPDAFAARLEAYHAARGMISQLTSPMCTIDPPPKVRPA
jgi:CHAD domain-containing protein